MFSSSSAFSNSVASSTSGCVRTIEQPPLNDFKTELQERLARRADLVDYEIESEDGPPHDRRFVALAMVDGEELGRGSGKTKKAAEQSAASRALERLEEAGR